jgi:hypothetical protein
MNRLESNRLKREKRDDKNNKINNEYGFVRPTPLCFE